MVSAKEKKLQSFRRVRGGRRSVDVIDCGVQSMENSRTVGSAEKPFCPLERR
jgi:hypothetical protein